MRQGNRILVIAMAFGIIACSQEPTIEEQSDEPLLGEVNPNAPGEDVQSLDSLGAPVYQGVWAADQSLCAVFPASSEQSPIAITEAEFVEFGSRCLIGNAEEGTEGGWRLGLICNNDGIEYSEVVDLDVDGEMLRLRHEGKEEEIYVRCSDV